MDAMTLPVSAGMQGLLGPLGLRVALTHRSHCFTRKQVNACLHICKTAVLFETARANTEYGVLRNGREGPSMLSA